MTKDLFLIRHSNAELNLKSRDFDRKLSSLGEAKASKMSLKLLQHAVIPQFILSSPATRAMSTCKLFAETLHIPFSRIQPENMIYEASINTLMSIINHINKKYDRVALFGHNPGLSLLTEYFTEESIDIPPAGIVHLQFDVQDWNEITGGLGRIVWRMLP